MYNWSDESWLREEKLNEVPSAVKTREEGEMKSEICTVISDD